MTLRTAPLRWLVVTVVGTFLVAGSAPATEAPEGEPDSATYELRYRLGRGEVLRYEVTHRASVRSTIDETTQAAQSRTDSVKLWKITDVLPSGEIELMNVVEQVRMANQLPDREPLEYDSRRDETPPPGFEDAARAIGVPLSLMRITPQGKIVRREIKVRNQDTQEDAPIVLRLPEEPVAAGDTWDEPFDVQVTTQNGAAKTIHTRRRHKLIDVKNGIATIEVTYQVLSPVDAHIECQLVQRLMEGEVRFDVEAGRIASQKMEIDKRILGFAGATSSMHYMMRMEEKLAKAEPKVADRPSAGAASPRRPAARNRPQPSSSRPRPQQPQRGYRR